MNVSSDEVLVVTGGTGSFGDTIVRRFLRTSIGEIRVFSRDEKKQEEMRGRHSDLRVRYYIGDTRDRLAVDRVMRGANYVFHAAALKQVPSCEFYPMEAYMTNVVGSSNVIASCIANRVQRLVLLSTDKAVYPINAMGISKAMAEKLLIAESRALTTNDTVLTATRYGNVMASRGSVIPLFIEKIKAGRPVTITDPAMTRFLMTLEQSVDLVLHAFSAGDQGCTYVQKAPACTVADLAQALCEIFDAPQMPEVIGTRHGEKLYETLVSREEMAKAQDEGLYFKIPADNRTLNYEMYVSSGSVSVSIQSEYTSHNTRRLSVQEVKDLLAQLPYVQQELRSRFKVVDTY
jgi:UDP-N-acetylglucosamine 4,6-dehydratase